ncbi:MAG TPA: PQQ-binding-like beta-propeller repeat protein [Planctomycetaceae bacterium]|nr:PQQ-binding-like beta-propeller repeat protein [Planctomycetaceae bacterium]
MSRVPGVLVWLVLWSSPLLVQAGENWPEFRGPTADGHVDAPYLPLTWSEQQNVVWKTPIHDRGWSSPVIWGKQVWLTTATADGHSMFAMCLDRETGKVLHDVKVFENEQLDPIAAINSYASPSPVIEAGRVYLHYGSYGTACLDTNTAQILWTRRDLKCDHHEGPGSSPILAGDLLIFHVDGRDVQYVIALDKKTGKTVWKTDRSIDYSEVQANLRKAYCTPIVVRVGEQAQLISPGGKGIMAYDPATGAELWKIRYNGWSITPRPLFGHGRVYFISDYVKPELLAIRPDGRGDVTDSHVIWSVTKGMPSRPSPLLVDDLLFVISSDGVASCLVAETGETVWKERIGGNFSASPIYANGRIYLFDQDSVATVIAAAREFKVLAVNKLAGKEMLASPAVAGEALFLRTAGHLYRIEDISAKK